MTSFSWFSGKSAPSRKFMTCPLVRLGFSGGGKLPASAGPWASEGRVAGNAGALHLAVTVRVIHDRVVLRATIVPKRHTVGPPAEAHLVFGDLRLGDQVLQQLRGTGRKVLSVAHIRGGVEIGEVGREPVDEEDFLPGLGMGAHDRMLGVGKLSLEREPLLDRHRPPRTSPRCCGGRAGRRSGA